MHFISFQPLCFGFCFCFRRNCTKVAVKHKSQKPYADAEGSLRQFSDCKISHWKLKSVRGTSSLQPRTVKGQQLLICLLLFLFYIDNILKSLLTMCSVSTCATRGRTILRMPFTFRVNSRKREIILRLSCKDTKEQSCP